MIPKTYFNPDDPGVLRLLSEAEWRGVGITQSLGWEHYEVHGMPSCLPHHTPHL
jgi:cyclin-dependent kinase regulatory subunit CKS1